MVTRYHYKNQTGFFEHLPFYWHPLIRYQDNPFPESLSFEIYLGKEDGVLKQKRQKKVWEILKKAYLRGSEIVGLMDDHGIGYSYFKDFLEFIHATIGLKNIKNQEILEIGCGTGYLLSRLKQLGGEVLGCEPGFSKIGKFPVEVIKDFFPSEKIHKKKFDIIIAYGLIEHLPDPENILSSIHKHLKDSGVLVLAVPDCEDHIRRGDISMFIHEHYSYFSKESLASSLTRKHFKAYRIQKSKFGGLIYALLRKRDRDFFCAHVTPRKSQDFKIFENIQENINQFSRFLNNCRDTSLGIFIPIRAMNILYLLRDLLTDLNVHIRFFDDSLTLIGKYLPCFDIEIEDRTSLIQNPPENVLIYSYPFGEKIRKELTKVLPKNVKLRTIEGL